CAGHGRWSSCGSLLVGVEQFRTVGEQPVKALELGVVLQRLEVPLDRALVAARGGSGDRVGRRELAEVVDRTGEQRRHALARGVTVEASLDGQRDRFSKEGDRVIRGEDRRGMVKGKVDTAQVEWMAV